jgi:hypothetical protein
MLPIPAAGATSDNFLEDGLDDPGPPRMRYFYGHRVDMPGDTFTNNSFQPQRMTGCAYRASDGPGIPGHTGDTVSVRLDFRGQAVDAATGNEVLNTADWSVNLGGVA